jgi:hypothetical protein
MLSSSFISIASCGSYPDLLSEVDSLPRLKYFLSNRLFSFTSFKSVPYSLLKQSYFYSLKSIRGSIVLSLLGFSVLRMLHLKSELSFIVLKDFGWIVWFKYDRSLVESLRKWRFELRLRDWRFLTALKCFFLLFLMVSFSWGNFLQMENKVSVSLWY